MIISPSAAILRHARKTFVSGSCTHHMCIVDLVCIRFHEVQDSVKEDPME